MKYFMKLTAIQNLRYNNIPANTYRCYNIFSMLCHCRFKNVIITFFKGIAEYMFLH